MLRYYPSRDPIEERGGLNIYVFSLNDDINKIDILGLDAEWDFFHDLAKDFGLGWSMETKKDGTPKECPAKPCKYSGGGIASNDGLGVIDDIMGSPIFNVPKIVVHRCHCKGRKIDYTGTGSDCQKQVLREAIPYNIYSSTAGPFLGNHPGAPIAGQIIFDDYDNSVYKANVDKFVAKCKAYDCKSEKP